MLQAREYAVERHDGVRLDQFLQYAYDDVQEIHYVGECEVVRWDEWLQRWQEMFLEQYIHPHA